MKSAFPTRSATGFTLVEVMMAATILVVGFIGMIQAMKVSSTMMDAARRQTLAAQIINHHIEKLRLLPWDVATAAPNELCIHDLPTVSTSITIDPQFDQARLALGDDKTTTATTTFSLTRTVTSPDPATNLREVNFTVTWKVATSRDGTVIKLTYTRNNSAYFGKYGLNLTYQRS